MNTEYALILIALLLILIVFILKPVQMALICMAVFIVLNTIKEYPIIHDSLQIFSSNVFEDFKELASKSPPKTVNPTVNEVCNNDDVSISVKPADDNAILVTRCVNRCEEIKIEEQDYLVSATKITISIFKQTGDTCQSVI
jgi:hypothetical protein